MTVTEDVKQELQAFRDDFAQLKNEIGKVIVGQHEILDDTLLALVAGGHVLLEGVPGLGKTLTVRTLADALQLHFQRIQFTPDLMPADLIGTNIVAEGSDGRQVFEFQKGPLFANVLLADEINRATHPLEMEGTYPLPEAQLDRFFCKLLVKYPSASDIETILDRTTESQKPQASSVLNGERILEMTRIARTIPIADDVRRYGIALVLATHPDHEQATESTKKYIRYGASPRGIQALILGAKIKAILDSRYHVAREDLRAMALPVLRHRLILNFEGQAEGVSTDDVIEKIIQQLPEGSLVPA